MNKLFTKIGVAIAGMAMAIGVGVSIGNNNKPVEVKATSVEITSATFDFEEASAHRDYNADTNPNDFGSAVKYYTEHSENDIAVVYSDSTTTGTPKDGSTAHIVARVAKNTTNSPYVIVGPVNLSDYNVMGLSYMAKGPTAFTITSSYSTNGSTWTELEHHTSTTTYTTYGNATNLSTASKTISEPSTLYFKVQASVTSTNKNNRDMCVDDIKFYGESTSATPLDSIACSNQSIDVVESVNLASLITFTPNNAANKTVSYAIKSGSDYIDLNTTTGVVTGKKGGSGVVTITPEDTSNGAVAIDVTITVSSIAASGLTIDNQYVIYANDTENSCKGELSGVESNLGTVETFTSSVPPSNSVFTAKNGYYENTIAFKKGDNYLSLTVADNKLSFSNSITANSSWIVTWNSETDAATLTNCVYTNRSLKFNYNSGNARFACYVSGQTDICLYHYVQKDLENFTIDESIEVFINDTATINVTYTPADAYDKNVSWSVTASNPNGCATVDEHGVVTGVAVGTATVTASQTIGGNPVVRTCEVTVLSNASEHRGTEADPFTVNDAVNVAKGIFVKDPDENALSSTGTYYIKGMITANITRTTSQLSFWIGDNADQTNAAKGGFEIYRAGNVYGTALGTKYTTNAQVTSDFNVGYYVLVQGTFTLYSGTTPETTSGSADVKWNSMIEAKEYAQYFITANGAGNTCAKTIENWDAMETQFATLSSEAKAHFATATHNAPETYTDNTVYTVEHAVARYDHALKMHSELRTNEFMGRVLSGKLVYSANIAGITEQMNQSSPVALVIIISSVIGVSIIGGYFFIRRRKEK